MRKALASILLGVFMIILFISKAAGTDLYHTKGSQLYDGKRWMDLRRVMGCLSNGRIPLLFAHSEVTDCWPTWLVNSYCGANLKFYRFKPFYDHQTDEKKSGNGQYFHFANSFEYTFQPFFPEIDNELFIKRKDGFLEFTESKITSVTYDILIPPPKGSSSWKAIQPFCGSPKRFYKNVMNLLPNEK